MPVITNPPSFSPHEIDDLLNDVYNKTFDHVLEFLVGRYPRRPRPHFPVKEAMLPAHIKYKYAPDGDGVEQAFRSLVGDESMSDSRKRRTKKIIENKVIESIDAAAANALTAMNKQERFDPSQRARFEVTARNVSLVKLHPLIL